MECGGEAVSLPTPTINSGAFAKSLEVHLDMSQVLATCGVIPAALAGALAARNFDLLSHHRKSIIKNARTWPGGVRAQRAIASRLARYGSKYGKQAETISDVRGESFAATMSPKPGAPLVGDALSTLETGRTVNTNEAMIVPILAGRISGSSGTLKTKQFVDAIKNHTFQIIAKGRARGLVIVEYAARKVKGEQLGVRSVIIGKLTKRREQSPMLKFFESFERVLPKHLAQMGEDMESALTAAGLARLSRKRETQAAQHAAWKEAYAASLASLPGKYPEARKAGAAAAKLVRARSLQDGAT